MVLWSIQSSLPWPPWSSDPLSSEPECPELPEPESSEPEWPEPLLVELSSEPEPEPEPELSSEPEPAPPEPESRSSPGSVRWSRGVSPPWSSPASVVLVPLGVAVLVEVADRSSRSSPGSVRWSRGVSPPWSSVVVAGLVGVTTCALAGTRTGTAWENEALPHSPTAAGTRAANRAARVIVVRFMMDPSV
ncbi:hypothetical protein EAH86_15275 [Pedococcus bigeumensis]|uniref:Uncharacterized protein n=1 Tax=Pedococcus bigeumensis TaxID=433644 RepID=A0A502CMK8_9MICO|nr:hypothetical protein EAH86_15275 [Pedococcus bigeumensis]